MPRRSSARAALDSRALIVEGVLSHRLSGAVDPEGATASTDNLPEAGTIRSDSPDFLLLAVRSDLVVELKRMIAPGDGRVADFGEIQSSRRVIEGGVVVLYGVPAGVADLVD